MKRIRASDTSPVQDRFLFVLFREKWERLRDKLGISSKEPIHNNNPHVYEYVVGSANPDLELVDEIENLFLEHGQVNPSDPDAVTLPILLAFICGEDDILRLPDALSDLASRVKTHADFGDWTSRPVLEHENTFALSRDGVKYSGVFFYSFDPSVFGHVIESEKLNE